MLERGARLGPYEIESLLGRGGMGEVYRGRDVRLRRPVAVKILAPELVRDREGIARFRREAETASALNHPNILTIYDIGEAEMAAGVVLHYIAMELIEGRTLREIIQTRSAPLAQQLGWMQQVATGLAKAHAAGVVHRDLKPDNIMVTADGFAKILDFGLAKLAHPQTLGTDVTGVQPHRTASGLVMGTVGYMSPEQAADATVDFRSDIFALGCILYEVAAGRVPFRGDSVVETLYQVIHAAPASLGGGVPAALERVIHRCLEKKADARYQSSGELAQELSGVAASLTEGDHSGTAPSAAPRTTGPASSASRDERSIAVLPFADLSPGRDHDYIGDGLADEVITDLSRVRALRVIARTSAMPYKNSDKPVSQIARELGVEFVLTGGVRVAGDRLRITTQLIEAAGERSVWGDRIDGTLNDIFDIQERVARAVAEQLRVHLSAAESGALRERPIPNVHAYECYLRARRRIWDFTESSLQQALDDIERAEQLVGENSLLQMSKAYVYWQYYNAGIRPDPSYLDKAEALVTRTAAVDPGAPQIDLMRGLLAIQRGNPSAAIRYLQRSLEIDRDVEALSWLMATYMFVGRTELGRQLARQLAELDPLGWMGRIGPLAIEMCAGELDRAVEHAMRLTPADRQVPIVGCLLVELYGQVARLADAASVAKEMAQRDPDDPFAKVASSMVDALHGRHDEARARLTSDVLAVARADLQYSSWVAECYALVGDTDAALDWLTNAINRGFVNYPYFAVHNRLLDRVRADPRVAVVLQDLRARWASVQ